jgi:hypothetical protein
MVRRIAVLICLAALCGCGYRAGFAMREDIHRVAVPVFGNNTFYRNIEIDLTRAVVDELETVTPYRIVDRQEADAVLEGRISGYRVNVLQEDALERPRENQIVLTADVTLRDVRTDRVLKRTTVREAESFVPPAGEDEISSRPALFRRTARTIVERAFEEDC